VSYCSCETEVLELKARIRLLKKAMKEWHAKAVELCEAELESNQIQRDRFCLKEGEHIISGEFRLNRAWHDFAFYEPDFKAAMEEEK